MGDASLRASPHRPPPPPVLASAPADRLPPVVEEEHSAPETIYVVYLPYLPLVLRGTVGDWELIPRTHLGDSDCLDARTMELAQGLAGLVRASEERGHTGGRFCPSEHGTHRR